MDYELIDRARLLSEVCKGQGFDHTAAALLALAKDLANDDSGPMTGTIVDKTVPFWSR